MKEKERSPSNNLLYIYIAGAALYCGLNIFVSGMNIAGVLINTTVLSVLIIIFMHRRFENLIFFIVLNTLLGPFLIVNLNEIDMPTIGRIDYLLGIVLLVFIFFTSIKQKNVNALVLTAVLTSLLLLIISDPRYEPSLDYIDHWFSIFGKISLGFLIYLLLNRDFGKSDHAISFMILSLLAVHFFLSLVQLAYPLSFRGGTIQSAINIMGVTLNRPVGLLEASYVYGMATLFIWFIGYKLTPSSVKKVWYVFLVPLVFISIISTRSVAVGILLFIVLCICSRFKTFGAASFLISSVLLLIIVLVNFDALFLVSDQSSATKLLLWWAVLSNWFNELPVSQSFFGYGWDAASDVAKSNLFFELANDVNSTYDNRIDSNEGFKIHNVFIQLLYEFGLISFLFVIWLLFKGLKNILSKKIDASTSFLWCVAVTNYSLHNGLFSPFLTALMLLAAFPSMKAAHATLEQDRIS